MLSPYIYVHSFKVIRHRMWDHAHPNPYFLLYENVGFFYVEICDLGARNLTFGIGWPWNFSRGSIPLPYTYAQSFKAIRHRMWDHAHPNPRFLLYENVGSLRRNWGFGRTRSHIRHRMAMKLCKRVHPITIYIRAKFQGHPTPNVRSRAPKIPFFTLQNVGSLRRNLRFGRTRSHIRHRMAMKLCTWSIHHHIHTFKVSSHLTPNERSRAPKSRFLLYKNVGSLRRNLRLGRTRSHIRHRMAMNFARGSIPSPYTYL